MRKLRFYAILCIAAAMFFATAFIPVNQSFAAEATQPSIVTTSEGLSLALSKAKSGETIYVGDIDFEVKGTNTNPIERKTVITGVRIVNGKSDGTKAVFTGGSFNLIGDNRSGITTEFVFEGIRFDGGIDTSVLTHSDWKLPTNSQGEIVLEQPSKAQYAVKTERNVKATFRSCDFENYMFNTGAAIHADYSDGSNSLELNLYDCNFAKNAAFTCGGAVALWGAYGTGNNVSFLADGCRFEGNFCGGATKITEDGASNYIQTSYGGAIYSKHVSVELRNTVLIGNTANHEYANAPALSGNYGKTDVSSGGGIYCYFAPLTMKNCVVTENKASTGGGIKLKLSSAVIDGCVVANNRAQTLAEKPNSKNGLSSAMGLGGGIYINYDNSVYAIKLMNTSIYGNYAQNALGAIGVPTNPKERLDLRFLFCTVENNTCETAREEYEHTDNNNWLWYCQPGDFWELDCVKKVGCAIADAEYPREPAVQTPSEDNGYNSFYVAAVSDSTEPKHLSPTDFSVPTEYVSTVCGGEFSRIEGAFYVGDNYRESLPVELDGNGVAVEYDLTYGTAELPAPVRNGYIFEGWVTEKGETVDPDQTLFAYGETLTLYAKWTARQFPVLFIVGGAEETRTQTYDTAWNVPDAQKNGYKFLGWYNAESGGEKVDTASAFAYDETLTLYARFEKKSPLLAVVLSVSGAIILIAGSTVAVALIMRRKKAAVAAGVTQAPAPPDKPTPDTSALSPREREVLDLLLSGKRRSEISEILYVGEETVKSHIKNIYAKLEVKSIHELFSKFN